MDDDSNTYKFIQIDRADSPIGRITASFALISECPKSQRFYETVADCQ